MTQLVGSEVVAVSRSRDALVGDQCGSPVSIAAMPKKLCHDLASISHPVASERYQSPLRYPGAKSAIARPLRRLLSAAIMSPCVRQVDLLVEPFAGGASASLRLVSDGTAERILLADIDPLVTDFWQTAAADTDRLVERMWDEWRHHVAPGGATAVARWDYWRNWGPKPGLKPADRRLAMATRCLFLNRTTFSGILHGKAGPIGGRSQASAYTIGCRWNPEAIERRLLYVGYLYESGRLVDVWRKSWRETLSDVPEYYPQLLPSRVVAYLDPPYLEKSATLYRASFDLSGGYGGCNLPSDQRDDLLHFELAEYLRRRIQFRWILSYDNHPLLTTSRWLYRDDRMTPSKTDTEVFGVRRWRISKRLVSTRYTAAGKAGKRAAEELLITTLPASAVPADATLRRLC